ncbi:MSHA biogenesis protein MshP [Massilia sp. YIM B04103]|uniref:MSHA biogenesis protein MshP n=1 Tax=Massilia sp. YIM B04103 TaxID=2963106 RepID=UPI002109EA7F|nr:MSHA biogenesis protein MshP [Massilia sp. YIM B04103]
MINKQSQRGFGIIAALIIVVMLSAFAAAIMRATGGQQAAANLDLLSANAMQAARAGTEWGLFRALVQNNCNVNQQLNFRAVDRFSVTVNCTFIRVQEGETTPGVPLKKRIYTIDAVACNTAGPCPDNAAAATPEYVERRHVATACATEAGGAC